MNQTKYVFLAILMAMLILVISLWNIKLETQIKQDKLEIRLHSLRITMIAKFVNLNNNIPALLNQNTKNILDAVEGNYKKKWFRS